MEPPAIGSPIIFEQITEAAVTWKPLPVLEPSLKIVTSSYSRESPDQVI
jgi:hypothetical protein